jgi:phosphoribosylformylglycinamidine synthase
MGFDHVADVRVGKHIRLTVEAADEASATAQVHEMATRVLSNPVIEDYEISQVAMS